MSETTISAMLVLAWVSLGAKRDENADFTCSRMAGRQYAARYSWKRAGDNYVCLYFDRSRRTISTARIAVYPPRFP